MKLDSIVEYMDGFLGVRGHPDYAPAMNGLQVEGRSEIARVAAAVDTSVATITAAKEADADLLLVHHGLFWGGSAPLTGPLFRRVRTLLEGDVALYSCHLPLDGHPEVGNCALLAKELGLRTDASTRVGTYKDTPIGWWGTLPEPGGVDDLAQRLRDVVDGPVHVIPGGPERVERVGVVTGGGASFVQEAARLGLDALVTGEGAHHTHIDAMEWGIHVLFGGHYATETFGVRALAEHVSERFGLDWIFIDRPTGL
ncbi:MAG: Nif3-like dinuclear metal center hexameric protein [Gemmatimonadota bacterium]|nr:Nif3-like dinuclear metal center hexameric protein [Gemmatimonadota bacterium]